ncbi:MAG TPA: hypothetical protein VGD40_11020 [Chryseosolibacter sp.]
MRVLLSSFMMCCIVAGVFAQTNTAETNSNLQSMSEGSGMFRTFDSRSKETKGSLKVFEDFLPGGITMNNGQEFEFSRMNYDGFYDAIIVIRKKQEQVVTTMMVKSFYIVDVTDTLHFDRLLRTDNRMGYYQRLTEGTNVRLYKKLFTTVQQATYTGAYSTGSTQAELIPGYAYYVQDGTLRPKEFKNKKMLFEMFPNEKEKLQQFVKENKTDFKKDKEVIALIEYLDSIKQIMPSN